MNDRGSKNIIFNKINIANIIRHIVVDTSGTKLNFFMVYAIIAFLQSIHENKQIIIQNVST